MDIVHIIIIVYSNDKWIAGQIFEHYIHHAYYDKEVKYTYEPNDVDEYLLILEREGISLNIILCN